jgi:sugar porter (SP) family MFS transporter
LAREFALTRLFQGLQALDYWKDDFNNPEGAILGLLVSCYSLGAITAIPFVPLVSDWVGRRYSVVFGSIVMIIGAILQGFSVNIAMFIFARIFLGHGIVYAIVAGAALLGELGHPKERQFLGSMFNAFYAVGALLGAGIVVQTQQINSNWSWRLPSYLQAAPSVIQVLTVFMIPESPRWLVSKDRQEEALELLIKYHAEGDASNPLPHAEFAEIKKALEIENEERKRGWLELFQNPAMRRRALVSGFLGVFCQFSGNALISQYLVPILEMTGITDGPTKLKFSVGREAWGFVVCFALASITPRFPRRRMYLLCTISLLLCYTAWTVAQARYVITESEAAGITVIFFIFLYTPCYNIAYNALTYVYLVELWPYYARTKGITWFQLCSRTASTFGAQVNPIGLKAIKWKYLLVYVCFLVFEIGFIYFLFPETFGKSLEELTFCKSLLYIILLLSRLLT